MIAGLLIALFVGDPNERSRSDATAADESDKPTIVERSKPRPEPPSSRAADEQTKRDPNATVLVEGRVLDVLGGPIEGVALVAHDRADRADRAAAPVAFARSDEHGRFELWLTPGRTPEHAALLWLNAQAPGYADATVVVRTPARGVTVSLFPESRLAGVVETEAGEPVAGVTVELAPPPLSLLPSWPRTVSDAAGRFELRKLAPGSYKPRVDDGRWLGELERIDLAFLERRDDLRIVVAAGHHVKVDVRAPDGSPCLEPWAWIVGVDRRSSERDADGIVHLAAIPSGEHRLFGGCEGAIASELAVEITADAELTITTSAGQCIAGRTLDERGDRVVGARVRADPPKLGLAHSGALTETDASGEFELCGLAAGKYLVHATRSDRISGDPVEISLELDDAPPDLELHVERGACIRGRVDGGPDVLTVLAGAAKRSPTSLRLPEDRRFEICGFEPSAEGRLWLEDPGARVSVPFVSDASTVEHLDLRFPDAAERELELRVDATPDHALRVRVDAEADALVRLVPRRESAKPSRCVGRPFPVEVVAHGVTSDGALTFEGLYPGRYLVHAEADGELRCAVVELEADSTELDLHF